MVNTGQQIGGSIGTSLLNTLAASATAGYLTAHVTPASPVTAGPRLALALVHGYTTAFWWSAAIFAAGALICGTLLRRGPLTQPGVPDVPAAGLGSGPNGQRRQGLRSVSGRGTGSGNS